MGLTKSLSLGGEVAAKPTERANGRNDAPSHPTPSGALPKGEPLDVRIFRGMGFALCLCITKAKLAMKQNDKQEFDEVMKVKYYKNKMIAPIIITVVVVLYYVVYFGFLISLLNTVWKYAFGMIPLVFSAIMVKVCIERINEIKKGEEDDISKY